MRISRVLSTTGKLVLSPGLLATRTRHLFFFSFLVYLTSFSLVFRDLNALLFSVMVDGFNDLRLTRKIDLIALNFVLRRKRRLAGFCSNQTSSNTSYSSMRYR